MPKEAALRRLELRLGRLEMFSNLSPGLMVLGLIVPLYFAYAIARFDGRAQSFVVRRRKKQKVKPQPFSDRSDKSSSLIFLPIHFSAAPLCHYSAGTGKVVSPFPSGPS